ncbi:MAG: 4Fe-4S binding protein [Pelolinea sp.]|nr:4Fe-4S binding protein [Pelolinea sp.]
MENKQNWALPEIDQRVCIVCGDCAAICPTAALGLRAGRMIFQKPALCTYCTLCEQICPRKAIRCEFTITTMERKR